MSGYMSYFPLPTPEGTQLLKLDLALVTALEAKNGLLKTAEELAAREMRLGDIILLLQQVYAAAGLAVTDDFLLRQSPPLLLAEVLLAILSPLTEMGAVQPVALSPEDAALEKPFMGKSGPGVPG